MLVDVVEVTFELLVGESFCTVVDGFDDTVVVDEGLRSTSPSCSVSFITATVLFGVATVVTATVVADPPIFSSSLSLPEPSVLALHATKKVITHKGSSFFSITVLTVPFINRHF